MKNLKLYTDGGARGNPGPAGIGGVLSDNGHKLAEFSEYIGQATNNQAEYQALLKGIELALENGAKQLDCYLDSELVVKQLNREYKVKDLDLQSLFTKIWNLTYNFDKITFNHVRREKNKEADKLVNQAIDKSLCK